MNIWQKLFLLRGRINRADFAMLHLAVLFAPTLATGFIVGSQLVTMAMLTDPSILQTSGTLVLTLLLALVLIVLISWIMFALSSKRLHDIGYSNWWQLIYLTPAAPLLFLVLLFAPGGPLANQYGLPPGQDAVTVIPPDTH